MNTGHDSRRLIHLARLAPDLCLPISALFSLISDFFYGFGQCNCALNEISHLGSINRTVRQLHSSVRLSNCAGFKCPLVPDSSQKSFNLSLFRGAEPQQRRARAATVEAVEVARVLNARDSHLAHDPAVRGENARLLLLCQLQIMVLPGEVNLAASLRRERRNPEDRTDSSGLERSVDL